MTAGIDPHQRSLTYLRAARLCYVLSTICTVSVTMPAQFATTKLLVIRRTQRSTRTVTTIDHEGFFKDTCMCLDKAFALCFVPLSRKKLSDRSSTLCTSQ